MKYYNEYMDRQEISPALHRRLLDLAPAVEKRPSPWLKWGTLCACCALLLGLGVWRLAAPPFAGSEVSQPGTELPSSSGGFVVSAPGGEKLMFPNIPYIHYQDLTGQPQSDAALAWNEGSFFRDLTAQQICAIFWGSDGKAAAENPKTEQGSLPWMLFWDGYILTGRALYDGGGRLLGLTLWGEHPDGPSFTLELRPGALPITCAVDVSLKLETSDVGGVAVTGWSKVYDRNGDGADDYICGSEFMLGELGVRFENVNSPMRSEYGGHSDMALGGAAQLNALFVRQATAEDGGLYVAHISVAEDIPEWRSAEFAALGEARLEAPFAPYLPTANIPGYGEFYGRLTYQEGNENVLWVRWSRGYDDVEVGVYLPEGDETYQTVDAENPAAYDTRLYETPWCDSVPEEYQDSVNMPTFRAEDMSLSIVEARGTQKDTGGTAYSFGVLHENGVLVNYRCDGLSAGQVWELVEGTL